MPEFITKGTPVEGYTPNVEEEEIVATETPAKGTPVADYTPTQAETIIEPEVADDVEANKEEVKQSGWDKVKKVATAVKDVAVDSFSATPALVAATVKGVVDTVKSYGDEAKPSALSDRLETSWKGNELGIYSLKGSKQKSEEVANYRKEFNAKLAERGIEVTTIQTPEGEKKAFKMPDGKVVPYSSSFVRDLINAKFETGGAIGGAILGSKAPGGIIGKAIGTVAGSAIGAATGSTADTVINSLDNLEKLEKMDHMQRAITAGGEDIAMGVVGATAFKIGKSLLNKGEQSLKYLKSALHLSDDEAEQLLKRYDANYEDGNNAIIQRITELSEQGGAKGKAFLKKALAEDSDVGDLAAKNYLKQTTDRADAVMTKARETNEDLYKLLLKHKSAGENSYYIDYSAVQKEIEQNLANGNSLGITKEEAQLFDNLAKRYGSLDKELFSVANERSVPTSHMIRTLQSDPASAATVGAARGVLNTTLDWLSPKYRHNTRVVEAIQQYIAKSPDPMKTMEALARTDTEQGRLAKELLAQSKKKNAVGEVAEEGMSDAEAKIIKDDIDTEAKALQLEKKQIDADNQAVALAKYNKIKDDNAVAKTIDNAETEEAMTALQKIVDDDATEATIRANAKETLDSLAKQKKVAEIHNEKIAKINYSASKYDLNVEKKAVADAEKQAKQADKDIAKLENDIQRAQGKEKAQLIKDKKVVQKVRDKFEKSASDYIVKLRKLAAKAKKTGKKEDVEVITEEIKQVATKLEGSLKAKKGKGDTPKQAEAERLKNEIQSEDELKEALQKNNFAKSQEPIPKMSKSEIAEQERAKAEELMYQDAEEMVEQFGGTVEEHIADLKKQVAPKSRSNVQLGKDRKVVREALGKANARLEKIENPTKAQMEKHHRNKRGIAMTHAFEDGGQMAKNYMEWKGNTNESSGAGNFFIKMKERFDITPKQVKEYYTMNPSGKGVKAVPKAVKEAYGL